MISESTIAIINDMYVVCESKKCALDSVQSVLECLPEESAFNFDIEKRELERKLTKAHSRIHQEWIEDSVAQLSYELQMEDFPYPYIPIANVSDLLAFAENNIEQRSPINLAYRLADFIKAEIENFEGETLEDQGFRSLCINEIIPYYKESRYCQTGKRDTNDEGKAVLDCMRAFETMMSSFSDPFTFQIDFYRELTSPYKYNHENKRFQTPGSMLRSVVFSRRCIDMTFWDSESMENFYNKVATFVSEGEGK